MSALFSVTCGAEPAWSERVDAAALSESAAEEWNSALESWDLTDRDQALIHLRRAAERSPAEPEIWLALAAAAEEAAVRADLRAAMTRLELASEALDEVEAIPALPRSVALRSEYLRRDVEARLTEVRGALVRLTNNPPSLSSLEPGMTPTPLRDPADIRARAEQARASVSSGGRSSGNEVMTLNIEAQIGGVPIGAQRNSVDIGIRP